ncbi:hypothetical protein Nmel_002064 [Mimus melanotis]
MNWNKKWQLTFYFYLPK